MGRALARSNTVGRVATTCMLTAFVAIMTACGGPEPVTATSVTIKSPSVGVNPDTKRPECKGGESITLSESTTKSPTAVATSAWSQPILAVKLLQDIHVVGALADEGAYPNELHGLFNVNQDVKAGYTLTFEARLFTPSPDLGTKMTQIDSLTLCIK